RLRLPDAAVLAGVEAEYVGGLMADHFQGILRREHTLVSHDRDAAPPPDFGHGDVIAAAGRLLEQGHVELLQPRGHPDCLFDGVAAIGIDRQPDVRPDRFPHGLQPIHVDPRVLVTTDLYLDRLPAAVHHAFGTLGGHVRLD